VAAKVALLGIDRSIEALATMAAEDDEPQLDSFRAQLRRLRREVEARFPSARAFVRPGLDEVTTCPKCDDRFRTAARDASCGL
jgi:hypothetical protein